MRGKRSGFTLLELLMVVIIIAILAAVALPQYLRVVERSRAAEALTMLAAIRGAELRFRAQDPDGQYTTLENLDIEIPGIEGGVVGAPDPAVWGYAANELDPADNPVASAARNGGAHDGDSINIDLNTGTICADNADAAKVWEVQECTTSGGGGTPPPTG